MANIVATLGKFTTDALRKTGARWGDIVRASRRDERADAAPAKVAAPAKPVVATADELIALRSLAELANQFVWPEERRELTASEQSRLIGLLSNYQRSKKYLDRLNEAMRTTAFLHLDAQAEANGTAKPDETPRDKDGFYLLEGEIAVEGRATKIKRQVTDPSVDLSEEMLRELVVNDELDAIELGDAGITHEQYLALTRRVRVVDEGKVMEAVREDPTLLVALAHASRVTRRGSVAMYERKA